MEEIIDNNGSASSHGPNDWLAIDWRRVEQHVRTMQMRIAKATQEGDWRCAGRPARSKWCKSTAMKE